MASQSSPMRAMGRGIRALFLAALVGLTIQALYRIPAVRDAVEGFLHPMPSVGLIAGHWQSDSGAVCPDGLREVDLNLAITRRVERLLRDEGYRVEVLPEYARRLEGYRADALVSIHVDSCVQLSGYKVARAADSPDPRRDDRLVDALTSSYAVATGLDVHDETVTEDMTGYHAFHRVAPETPAAIIECGFMGGDRSLLTQEQGRVAAGIANGIVAFIESSEANQ
ncbi:MAG: N-acetylmuramoyl-L-alanine amidase [Anaerolineae bacterium]